MWLVGSSNTWMVLPSCQWLATETLRAGFEWSGSVEGCATSVDANHLLKWISNDFVRGTTLLWISQTSFKTETNLGYLP